MPLYFRETKAYVSSKQANKQKMQRQIDDKQKEGTFDRNVAE